MRRVAGEIGVRVEIQVRSARGGHPRALEELQFYQRGVLGLSLDLRYPDVLIAAIDANCDPYAAARKKIESSLSPEFLPITAVACPEPHIERWYMADPASFAQVVGKAPRQEKRKCDRNRYKKLLAESVRAAGHPALLGGIEFASEIVTAMDLYRAGKRERSLKHFMDEVTRILKQSRH